MSTSNPYDWTHHRPRRTIVREALLMELAQEMLSGHGCVLVGGRGMGKSVILHEMLDYLAKEAPEVKVIYFPRPPVPATIEASLQVLAAKLGVPPGPGGDAGDILERYFAAEPGRLSCVLMFDELDQYVSPRTAESLSRTLLNHLEAVRRDSHRPIGILIAGGLGLYVLRDHLASAFMSRVHYAMPLLFSEAEISELAGPFAERGRPLKADVIKSIYLASGGNPALVTYGLQHLWQRSPCDEHDVSQIYSQMREKHPDFLRDIVTSVAHPDFSEAPLRVWSVIRREGPTVPRAMLLQALSGDTGVLRMDLDDVLRLLRAAGLVTLRGSSVVDPLDLRSVASLLNLPEPSPAAGSLREQLVQDLTTLLTSIHRWAPDFFHTPAAGKDQAGKKKPKETKRIVPEAVFSAILAIGLSNLGWQVEREPQQGAGRTDLKLSRSGESAVVEVKIWKRNDYAKIHAQVEGYWATPDVRAAAAVTLTDQDIPSFAADYRAACLVRADLAVEEEKVEPPLRGHFAVASRNADGFDVLVDHLLLRVPSA